MSEIPDGDVTGLLARWADGDRRALDRLIPIVYEDLSRLAHRERRREDPNATLVTAALVHEAYLRLVDQSRARFESRSHFLNVAAQMMRRVLVDAARKRRAGKRGGAAPRVPLDEVNGPRVEPDHNLMELDEALTQLAAFDPHLSRVVELRYFGGVTLDETAKILGVSTTTAWRDWNTARAWLFDHMTRR